jgi:hypothetical protein
MALPALMTSGGDAVFEGGDKAALAGRVCTRNSMVFFIPPVVYKTTARRFQKFRDCREFREKKIMRAAEKWQKRTKANQRIVN